MKQKINKWGKMVIKGDGVVLCTQMGFKGWFSVNSNLRGGFVQTSLFKGWFSAIWPISN